MIPPLPALMATTTSLLPPPGWGGDAGRRIGRHTLLKMFGTMIFMGVFFVLYFWLLKHARLPVRTVPRIFIDRMIVFRPGALPLYVSLWFYVALAPALIPSRRQLWSYAAAAAALSLIGFAIFIIWPTNLSRAELDPAMVPSLAYLKEVDASGNAFPSLHVAFAVFTACWFERLLREMRSGVLLGALNWAWCLGIIYSTIAIRQHVALDAVAGAVLGALVAALHLWLVDRLATFHRGD
jgi:membrane-associated phospholipid phosphatase